MLVCPESNHSLSMHVNQLFLTGGSGGLGRAIIDEFTCSNWKITAPNRFDLDLLKKRNPTITPQPVDLLVCADGLVRDKRILDVSDTDWDEIYAVNYQAAADCSTVFLPAMIEKGGGHILFISSYSAIHPPIGQVAYATAKAALIGLTTDLARQNGPFGIRVNCILPGYMETKMTQNVTQRRKAQILADHSLGRLNTPKKVSGFIRYLHEELTETSGQVFQLDNRPT